MNKYFSIKSFCKIITVILAILFLNFIIVQLNTVIEDNSAIISGNRSWEKILPTQNDSLDNIGDVYYTHLTLPTTPYV